MAVAAPRPLRAPPLHLDVVVTEGEAQRLRMIFSKPIDERTARCFLRGSLQSLLGRVMKQVAAPNVKVTSFETRMFLLLLPRRISANAFTAETARRTDLAGDNGTLNPPSATVDPSGGLYPRILPEWNLQQDYGTLWVYHDTPNSMRVTVRYRDSSERPVATLTWSIPPPPEEGAAT